MDSSNKIHVSGKEGNWNEARIWTVDKKTRRTDLAFPLSASGTGVGQVLAILYVAIASEEPRTIIIDEPNSFLHPGAAKKLIQILNKFPQHQYFISTHSPEILSAAKPLTITRLKYVDGETIAESINLEQTKDLRETLDEIGVRFSDVFFSENILWVEGETEEKAFSLILEKTDRIFDVAILPLVHTDDLRERKSKGRKHAKLVFEIYKRLSGANALTPPFVAVILDKESANEQEFKELEKIGGGKLKFITRKMYENYLIDANAIANVLNNEITENENKLSVEQVKEWISEQRNAMFLSEKETGKEILEMSDWIETVHAAELLAKLFSGLSAKTVEYRKTTHSVKLTEWLLENKPEQLAELKDFLLKILSAR
jgi:ABC-type multidrug transport system ATPase subunit